MANDITHFFVTESGRINYDIYERSLYTSPWISLPKKESWQDGMGEVISNIMWERPYIVGSEKEWSPMTINDGSGDTDYTNAGGSCIPPIDLVNFAQTLRTTSLFHKAVESPRFCVTDMLYTAKREAQMGAVERGLNEMVRTLWIKWNRRGFYKYANKYVITSSLPKTDENVPYIFPDIEPTSRLTNGVLDYFYNLLCLEQGHRHALSTQNGRPVFGLITDQLTSRFLIRGNDAIREDFRYGAPDQLLKPLGVTHTYNGFVHMMDEAPPRFNFNASDASDSLSDSMASDYTDPWEEVPHYVLVDGKPEVNPAWLTAEYQDTFIYVKDAYKLRVPSSITSVSKAQFNPQTYMGDFQFQNVKNLDQSSAAYNPDGKLGNFRGVLASGFEPINPHVMFVLRHKVCPLDLDLVGCDGNPVSA